MANSDTLTDYQVLVQFDTQTPIAEGKMNADGSDLRFTSDFAGWLDYWIENGIQGEFGMDEAWAQGRACEAIRGL